MGTRLDVPFIHGRGNLTTNGADEHEENEIRLTQRRKDAKDFGKKTTPVFAPWRLGVRSPCEIEIRAAHEIMAARTTQLALLIDQLLPALQAKPPMLSGNVWVRRNGTGILTKMVGRI
jgi:hypothetical protein